jgi:hypothetical protein
MILRQRTPLPHRVRTAGVLAVVLLIAVALRLPGYLLGEPLWVDEAWRAVLALDPEVVSKYVHEPSVFTAATAPVYVLLLKGLALLGVSELSLRASSFLSGVLAVALAWLVVARRAQGTLLLPFFAALLVAGNYSFVRYSNELKPYMFEVVVHLALLYFWVRFVRAPMEERRAAFIALVASVVAALFCGANTVFAIPALGLSALYAWIRGPRVPGPAVMLAGCATVLFAMGILYFSVWVHGRDSGLIQVWSQGFNLRGEESYAAFIGARLHEISTDGAFHLVHHDVRGSSSLIPVLWGALGFATVMGIVASLARRSFELVLFCGTFVLTAVALNFFSFWPLGAFAQNQFLYLHVIIGAVLLLNEVRWALLRYAVVAIAVVIIVIGWLRLDQHRLTMEASPPIQQSSRALAHVAQRMAAQTAQTSCSSPREQIFLNPGIGAAFDFYTRYHEASREALRSLRSGCTEIVRVTEAYSDAEKVRQEVARALRAGVNPWFAYGHLYGSEIEDLKRVAQSFGRVSDEARFTGAGAFRLQLAEDTFRHTR